MKYLLLILFAFFLIVYFRWYKFPIPNVLAKDLNNSTIVCGGKRYILSRLPYLSFTEEKINNTHYSNLFREYLIRDKKFIYKALAKRNKIFNIRYFIVVSSEINELENINLR